MISKCTKSYGINNNCKKIVLFLECETKPIVKRSYYNNTPETFFSQTGLK